MKVVPQMGGSALGMLRTLQSTDAFCIHSRRLQRPVFVLAFQLVYLQLRWHSVVATSTAKSLKPMLRELFV